MKQIGQVFGFSQFSTTPSNLTMEGVLGFFAQGNQFYRLIGSTTDMLLSGDIDTNYIPYSIVDSTKGATLRSSPLYNGIAGIGLGTNTPNSLFHILSGTSNLPVVINEMSSNDSGFANSFRRVRTGNSAIQTNDLIGSIIAEGYTGHSYQTGSSIRFVADSNFNNNTRNTRIEFATALGLTLHTRLVIKSDGKVGINNGLPEATLDVIGTIKFSFDEESYISLFNEEGSTLQFRTPLTIKAENPYLKAFSSDEPFIPTEPSHIVNKDYVDGLFNNSVTTPGGNNTEVQFNNSGNFGASSDFKYDSADKKLSVLSDDKGKMALFELHNTEISADIGSYTTGYYAAERQIIGGATNGLIVETGLDFESGFGFHGRTTFNMLTHSGVGAQRTNLMLLRGTNNTIEFPMGALMLKDVTLFGNGTDTLFCNKSICTEADFIGKDGGTGLTITEDVVVAMQMNNGSPEYKIASVKIESGIVVQWTVGNFIQVPPKQ